MELFRRGGFAGAEAEGVAGRVDLNVLKASGLKAVGERGGIDHRDFVAEVEKAEQRAGGAVGSGEKASGAEYAEGFGEEAVLARSRDDVVEHHEADDGVEGRGG